jgi:hypothetical protein
VALLFGAGLLLCAPRQRHAHHQRTRAATLISVTRSMPFRESCFYGMFQHLKQMNDMAQECGRALGSGARNDLDRARSTAERFQRPEMRLIALLQIGQAALTSDGSAR